MQINGQRPYSDSTEYFKRAKQLHEREANYVKGCEAKQNDRDSSQKQLAKIKEALSSARTEANGARDEVQSAMKKYGVSQAKVLDYENRYAAAQEEVNETHKGSREAIMEILRIGTNWHLLSDVSHCLICVMLYALTLLSRT